MTISSIIRKIFVLLALLFIAAASYATHYRAGEILYEQITERRYKITAISYTDPSSFADPSTIEIEIKFGDGSSEKVKRISRNVLSTRVVQNVYEVTHEYRVDGTYIISYYDQNRVNGIVNVNLGNTEYIPFYVESLLKVNQSMGPNRSPILTKPPIDNGCEKKTYFHNPAAYDPDGDSLTFEFTTPKQNTGVVVPNYSDPEATNDLFEIGLNNGQVKWNAPTKVGIYNIAILIKEYRKGFLVGYVVRDMQIFIDKCLNNPPTVQDIADGCVVVGDSISRIISANETDTGQRVSLHGFGGPFSVDNKSIFTPNPAIALGSVSTRFSWNPTCNQIRYRPWQVIFEARDDQVTSPAVNQNSFFVTVIGPPVLNVKTKQIDNGFNLTWNKDTCGLVGEYRIYRRIDSSHWNPSQCETGVPAYTGFKLLTSIKTINNPNITSFYDDNNGVGLSPLVRYCYRIVVVYPPRSITGQIIFSETSESIASIEVCDNIILSSPEITKVSILNTSTTNGKINVAFITPKIVDTTEYVKPYKIVLNRKASNQTSSVAIATFNYNNYTAMVDAEIEDSLLNTFANQYVYSAEFWATVNDTFKKVSSGTSATSIRNTMYSTDKTNIISWNINVPWVNDSFVVYRKNNLNNFDSIGITAENKYSDIGLTNNVTYCYLVKSLGNYRVFNNEFSTINFSHEICGTPIDTIKPCAPQLLVTPPCGDVYEYRNFLDWIPNNVCAYDVVKYRIYHKQLLKSNFALLIEVANNQTRYVDDREELKLSITGCYYIAGVDSAGNESDPTNITCVENCPTYRIPNVFTPNGNGFNDTLYPFPYRFVNSIDMVIFNRWGEPVFETKNIDILWDGKDAKTQKDLPDGVYYYICEVNEIYLDGIRKRTLRGTIQIIR
ncbi:MAG: gliding motility-associated C-terminal domain-containing protein [Bacteroidia bacterium]|nr:gliding motility-associated C-terminal domain-containing protein [Bacteroidia bacterium]MBP9689541.1 gliding motility-associated C-terminal domain-containing protein [Bacteroidia bacterium]